MKRKFLGFYVGKEGIRPNPEKVEAIINTTPPRTIRELHKLKWKINALSHFISKNAEKGQVILPVVYNHNIFL